MPWTEFDIHGRCALRVEEGAASAPQLRDMFAPFRTATAGSFGVAITSSAPSLAEAAWDDSGRRYSDDGLDLGEIQIRRTDEGFRLAGRGEMLVPLLPLLDRLMVERGAAMIHAATVDWAGHGICIAAAGGAGKTSALAALVRRPGVSLMGDDWAFLAADGTLLGYAKPIFVRPHHRELFPHLFVSGRKPMLPNRFAGVAGRAATAVHPMIARYPHVARTARRWWPEHMIVPVRDAFPSVSVSTACPLTVAVFLERADCAAPATIRRDAVWMAGRLGGNFHSELPRGARELLTALDACGLVPLALAHGDKDAVLRSALDGVPAIQLRIPREMPIPAATAVVVSALERVLCGAADHEQAETRC